MMFLSESWIMLTYSININSLFMVDVILLLRVQTGLSPLASGQWPAFLAFYAGIWAVQNFARPARCVTCWREDSY